jgi:hypothetical protein
MSTSNTSLQKPTCISKKFTTVEEMLSWITSHKPLCRDIHIKFRILSITFCIGPTSFSIQTFDDGDKSGFMIEYRINNELDSHKIHLFEKQIFFQYLKEYFLTPAEYKQWMEQFTKDIEKSKRLKQLHDSGKCVGPQKFCRYCIHEQRNECNDET